MCLDCPVFSIDLPIDELILMGCQPATALNSNTSVTRDQIWNWWLQHEREPGHRSRFGLFIRETFEHRKKVCDLYGWNPTTIAEMLELELDLDNTGALTRD